MLPIHTILYPTDFSDSSVAAFEIARTLAEHTQARLVILYVESPLPHPANDLESARKERAETELIDRLRSHLLLTGDTPVEYEVIHGIPKDAILDTAEKVHADVIVMGTHGRSGVGRLLMGSVAEAVSRAATCPVVTVRGRFAAGQKPVVIDAFPGETGAPTDIEAGPNDWRTVAGPFESTKANNAGKAQED